MIFAANKRIASDETKSFVQEEITLEEVEEWMQ